MRKLLAVLSLLLVACTADPGTTSTNVASHVAAGGSGSGTGSAATPSKPVFAPGITAADISGLWVLTSKGSPAAGALVACTADQSLSLTFDGNSLQGSVNVCISTCHQIESLSGTYADGQATLTGKEQGNLADQPTPVYYLLKYDPATQHLVGTRNGVNVWAQPFVVSTAQECKPSPTPEPIPTLADGTIIPGGDPPL